MDHIVNKTVSLGDTGISLHTPAPVYVWWGWWYSRPTEIQSPSILYLAKFTFGGGGVLQTNWNPKSLNLAKFSFGMGSGCTLDQLKSQVPSSAQIFIWGGGGALDQHSWNTWVGALKEFSTKNSGNWNVVVHRRQSLTHYVCGDSKLHKNKNHCRNCINK